MGDVTIGAVGERPAAPAPAKPRAEREPAPPLEPAVSVEIRRPAPAPVTQPLQGQFVRDPDSRRMIYQALDPETGRVVLELPRATALRARVYAAGTGTPAPGSTVATEA